MELIFASKAYFKKNYLTSFRKILKFYIICALLLLIPLSKAETYKNKENIFQNLSEPKYNLSPGDKISIQVLDLFPVGINLKILPDGFISLPRIGLVRINGLNLDQANKLITEKYTAILKDPIVYLDLMSSSPLRVSITGAVNDPGFHLIKTSQNINSEIYPTLIDAIQTAGGINKEADIRNIEINRYDAEKNSSQKIKINFWDSLKEGRDILNPYIYYGDNIFIPKVTKYTPFNDEEIRNDYLNPKEIKINIVGEVLKPGSYDLKFNSKLANAIFTSGGLLPESSRTNIKLIRLNKNGQLISKKFTFNLNKQTDETNPTLKNGDTVIVFKNKISNLKDNLEVLTGPIKPILDTFRFYNLF